jgi:histidinol-phosphate aminotransferase
MVRPLAGKVVSYDAPSTEEIVRRTGLRASEIIRFDGNTSPQLLPSTRAEAIEEELARLHTYPHGGYPRLEEAIARYAGVSTDNLVLGAGADDLIILVVRAFAGPGDRVAITNDPTYPMFSIAVWVAGAVIADEQPALTICCRPNNPTGELGELPAARPLLVDEAYFEYSGVTALDLIEDDVIVLRTFSKAFALAGARAGYAIAGRETAAALRRRQHPGPLSTLSAALGFEPWPSHANFLFVPVDEPAQLSERLMRAGRPVRPVPGGIRITVRNEDDDEDLLQSL